ncbi:type II toxin-antitoxin system PemK/MazF family toxin [Alkaliphilus sp. B6464]|uniref:type II toxin-antitoxin system PemK/MazF family toxin n=1 Tax=Alkaliphilus sp. B6464 TaxID=2731219 RepID=UPI001BAC408B|nr:type II toxin-antitoxin system PemK/MazF family toxin [Alkaliphilus sp. B6464]QUH22044.1 type II toxin-antitoxin system PemK/MazF family toxin [Alkaliphilus sp. B6464]
MNKSSNSALALVDKDYIKSNRLAVVDEDYIRKLNENFSYIELEKVDTKNLFYEQGSIVYVDLGEGEDSEQSGVRPCVVIQNNIGNKHSTTTIIAPITKEVKRNKNGKIQPTHFIIENYESAGLKTISTILAEQIRVISKNRILDYKPIGKLDIDKFKENILIALGID